MANKNSTIVNKVGDEHRNKAENLMAHALAGQWPFG
jgi:hypothetical protein